MKKALLIITGMILATALVFAGWFFGARAKFVSDVYAVTLVDKSLIDLTTKELLLNELQEGKFDDVKDSLLMDINVAIISVDAFRDTMDSKNRELSRKIFSKIAQDRAKYTNGYSSNLAKLDSDLETRIQLILKQASESQTNK